MIYLNHVLKKKENIFLFIYFSTRSTFLTAQNSFINGAELKKLRQDVPDDYCKKDIINLFIKQMGIVHKDDHSKLAEEIKYFVTIGDFECKFKRMDMIACFNPTLLTLEGNLWLVR